jgi:D-alanyl-lipoteichoic acid acyltransferase DltB (MBOAT superfamily)
MLFNSLHFLIFLLLVVPVYFACRGQRARNLLLLGASYYFYMVFSIPLVALLAWSTALNYVVARRIDASRRARTRTVLLVLSIVGNLGMLFFFKYYNFFAFSLSSICGVEGGSWVMTRIVLPMGISFYTFQAMSYTIDVYRRRMKPTDSLLDMALYISFFPQLVAGPIMRGPDLMPQFQEYHHVNLDRIQSGLGLAVWGLAKKSFIADPMGELATTVFGAGAAVWRLGGSTAPIGDFSSLAILMATWAFTIQIYCDFSGYTDIARGVARMLGFRLMRNFDRPYLATSIQDFWRRWHISLSTWLRDYLYIPLGGNRKGRLRTYLNLMITMVLGGLWHGANWTFVAWGALHGAMLCIERAVSPVVSPAGKQPRHASVPGRLVRWFVTFNLVCVSWIFFRATTFGDALDALGGMAAFRGGKEIGAAPLFILSGMIVFQLLRPRWELILARLHYPTLARWTCYATLLFLVILYAGSPSADFLYFQF